MTLTALRALVETMTPPPSTVVKALIAVAEAAKKYPAQTTLKGLDNALAALLEALRRQG